MREFKYFNKFSSITRDSQTTERSVSQISSQRIREPRPRSEPSPASRRDWSKIGDRVVDIISCIGDWIVGCEVILILAVILAVIGFFIGVFIGRGILWIIERLTDADLIEPYFTVSGAIVIGLIGCWIGGRIGYRIFFDR